MKINAFDLFFFLVQVSKEQIVYIDLCSWCAYNCSICCCCCCLFIAIFFFFFFVCYGFVQTNPFLTLEKPNICIYSTFNAKIHLRKYKRLLWGASVPRTHPQQSGFLAGSVQGSVSRRVCASFWNSHRMEMLKPSFDTLS